jgi:hypothetical protein
MNDLATIFLSCLNQQQNLDTTSGVSEGLSRDICKTHAIVQEAVEELLAS